MNKVHSLPKIFAENWVKALKETSESKHGKKKYYDLKTDCYCAMGLGYKANNIELLNNGFSVKSLESDPFASFSGKSPLWFEIVRLNDLEEFSFKKIAEFVETNVNYI